MGFGIQGAIRIVGLKQRGYRVRINYDYVMIGSA